ncbi:MAG: DUF2239 family protein [Thermomonas sp.]|uniref:DUF2239 family protein n=1 Tax=Thermomonas sp. TaxID=1971895 RepID=UPI0039E36A3F
MSTPSLRCTAFSGTHRIASGELRHVAMKAKQAFDLHPDRPVRVFDDADGRNVELPLELPAGELLRRLSLPLDALAGDDARPAPPRRPGRPKLGVVAREVTLLPRHWDWLAAQPGGASVALRKLVEDARRVHADDDRRRAAQEAAFRFMQAMAGDEAGFEDAARALFAGDAARFEEHIARWPDDVREHASWLATDAFAV